MFNKLSLKKKLISFFLLSSLIPLLIFGYNSFKTSSNALEVAAVEKLVAVRHIKSEAIKRYFDGIRDQVLTFADDVMIQEAMLDFTTSFESYLTELNLKKASINLQKEAVSEFYKNEFAVKFRNENSEEVDIENIIDQLSDNEIALQNNYIAKNTHPLGSKETLDYAMDNTKYSQFHRKYHPSIRNFLKKFGYYDIFLVDIKNGHIVYSVFKELDFATSLLTGPYKDTNFGQAFKEAKNLDRENQYIFVDYKKYLPSYNAPASFIAAPIWNNGVKIGVLMFQMPIDRINSIMGDRAGMGVTGETYLFGSDKLMRSDSFLDNQNYSVVSSFKNPTKGSLSGDAVKFSLEGKTDSIKTKNYLDHEVLSAFGPIKILDKEWGMISEISVSEAFSASYSIQKMMLIVFALSFLVIFILAYFISNTLDNQISSVATKLRLSTTDVKLSSDKILGSSVQLSESVTEQAASLQETVSSIDEISSMIQKNSDGANFSRQASDQSNKVALIGKKTVNEMLGSISSIAKSNDLIADEMKQSNQDIEKVVKLISDIGEKTKVINDIAFQTKLLSFNASVEAARAGEHGKGFAVVAQEVGNLADVSSKAALEINLMLDNSLREVNEIFKSTKVKVEELISSSKNKVAVGNQTAQECAKSLDEIINNVSSVSEMVREIASASVEQSTGVQEVTKAMQQLDTTNHQNAVVAQESSNTAQKLKIYADNLNQTVNELMAIVEGVKAE